MYSYLSLGQDGQLGNQMFQYAALYSLANFHNTEGMVPDRDIQIYKAFPDLSLTKAPPEEILNSLTYQYIAKEHRDFVFDPALFSVRENTNIKGFYQSPLYFETVKQDIFKEFAFHQDIFKSCLDQYNNLKTTTGTRPICALHIRRTDYLEKTDFHNNLTLKDYYYPAIRMIEAVAPTTVFLIFSDDYEWCKENLPEGVLYHDSIDQYHDMCLMSLCDMHIIANSSFSWWGAYLSQKYDDYNEFRTQSQLLTPAKATVIAPAQWFGIKGPASWNTIWDPSWYVAGLEENPMSALNVIDSDQVEQYIYRCKIRSNYVDREQ